MCRHLGYLGPPVPLSRLLLDPPHALVTQAWAPRDMRGGGTINADGFGVGWWPPGAAEPVRYRSAMPIWTDAALPSLAAATRSGAVLAAVRSATVGLPVVETAAAPFTDGRWLFSHNGVVRGWPSAVAGLAGDLPVEDLLTMDAPTDSATLWALLRARLRAGEPAPKAVAALVADVAAAAPGSRLNLLLTDGTQLIATAHGHALSVHPGRGSVLIGSEPLDASPAWQPVPDGHLVVATASALEMTPTL
ncbi:gamma-glutamyl-hercynylcysteine sulfoxide hydrolase [Actinoplanes capillaceus]|uniref:Gamma-glutamyl-hercynylcysteine sulfoxide hydrolase n=1 Tax=Actinoplanes campanulatus TaxID=113559 RepID=A0ABQ3WXK6_9ACTN|nr:ergothioneine biosynthesis protein EgtC [Actinoplanes capillaceus]GID50957.1 gamma-glutamyl-hercynylcysteine sulfoxide hydrolase [Actinoplanes capillaceus]